MIKHLNRYLLRTSSPTSGLGVTTTRGRTRLSAIIREMELCTQLNIRSGADMPTTTDVRVAQVNSQIHECTLAPPTLTAVMAAALVASEQGETAPQPP